MNRLCKGDRKVALLCCLGCYVRKSNPFFLAPRAQRRTYFASRNQTPLVISLVATSDKGAALDLRAFEKARSKLFMSWVIRVVWCVC
jgi:hypothetical protein